MERMKVLLVEPMERPRMVEIDHTLEAMQELVGGDIACTYPWEDMVGLVHCDDAIALGYPLNRMLKDDDGKIYDVVPGAFFLCGLSEDNFDSLPDSLAKKYTVLFQHPEMYLRTEDDHVLCLKLGSDKPPIQIV